MKKESRFPLVLLIGSIAGMFILTLWNFLQVRHDFVQSNRRWVTRVSNMIVPERLSWVRWIDDFAGSPERLLTQIGGSSSNVSAVFLTDTHLHETRRWQNPSIHTAITLDPRLVSLGLDALQSQKTIVGPVLFIDQALQTTVIRPFDDHRVLVAIIRDPKILTLLDEEAHLWRVTCFIYDFDGHLIFSTRNPSLIADSLSDTISSVRMGTKSGVAPLHRAKAWQWVSTFHYDAATDWIFIIAQPSPWVYMPLLFFILASIGMAIMAKLPWRGINDLTRQQWRNDLGRFAMRVDHFVHGKDPTLPEPPYPFTELVPVVTSLRWLMPQWKKAEEFPHALALDRKLLELLVETLPEGIIFFNAQGVLQLSNETGRVFLALDQEAGKEYKMVSGVQVPRGFLEPYAELVFLGKQHNVGKEVEVAWADGKHLYRVWVECVEESEGVTAGFIIVIKDITFRKQWEYVQEQVLSGITHDLRGPLSAVLGYLDLLRRQVGENGPPKQIEYIRLAREAGNRLSQMVNDILDVVRFEQGKVDLQVESLSVSEMFKHLHTTFGVTSEQKKVALKFMIQADPGMVATGDPKLLERVLDNLVGNAIKFTPSGGQITVTAERKQGRSIFQVTDTGRGIPREAQSRIFDKFQQVRPGDRSGGYGLGLAVVKFIVEAHKGEIRVESEVGAGSHFTFWIPDLPTSTRKVAPPMEEQR